MEELQLTPAERKQILDQRQSAERRRWIVEGMFLASSYLASLGDECCGGSGGSTNPATGDRYGEPYYQAADTVSKRAAYLSANPQQINV